MQARESLNRLMGLWGDAADHWEVVERLPALDTVPANMEEAEQVAVESSLDLAIASQELQTFAHQQAVTNATALLPHFKLGVDAEREGAWEIGPGIGFPIPLFDQGKARKESIRAQIRQKQEAYYGLAVDVRSSTRALRQEIITRYRIASHYRDVIVPLSSRIAVGMQEQYNAMQIGVFQLLTARQQEVAAGTEYIDAMLAYWLSHSNYELLMQGIMPGEMMAVEPSSSARLSLSPSPDDH